MTAALPKCLARGMETSATGYAAVIDGILDIRTVCESKNWSALNAIYARGFTVEGAQDDADGVLYLAILSKVAPEVRIIPIRVSEVEDD